MDDATSPIEQIAELTRSAKTFRMNAEFELSPKRRITSTVFARVINNKTRWSVTVDEEGKRGFVSQGADVADLIDAMRWIASSYPKATLLLETIELSLLEKGSTTSAKLKPIIARAWHEVAGLPVPTPAELAELIKKRKTASKSAQEGLIALLKSGPGVVGEFNRRPHLERESLDLRKSDLAGAHLDGIEFGGANLEGADLSGASLVKAKLAGRQSSARVKGARFVQAKLSEANFGICQGADADFSGADLRKAWIAHASLVRTKFVGADLSEASLTGSDVRGADFTDAKLDDLAFLHGKFDETTKWPAGYLPPSGLSWKGKGPDPRLAPTAEESAEPPPADAAGLLERLKSSTDEAKLDKALSMLKADRFQLFARVAEDHLVGVVKSQSDSSLVYACRLGSDGQYACCTQNLNVCGGLRGSPCKHLLVLVLGLAQAGQIDPGTVHAWSQASRGLKSALDKDEMAEVFLRYKGAEAGEVDWRPTETIPEDFYAM